MKLRLRPRLNLAPAPILAIAVLVLASGWPAARAQTLSNFDRDRGRVMLGVIKNEIKKNYYDPSFRGIDLEARFKAADEKITSATIVVGDWSAGAVMRALHYEHQLGADTVVFYGASVTDADLIMSDGRSLERIGVTPDETLLPTAADIAAKRDPVLARAA
ncbi:MAG: hypothetical protein WAU45_15875, partial [Blastocatellia bacterium]